MRREPDIGRVLVVLGALALAVATLVRVGSTRWATPLMVAAVLAALSVLGGPHAWRRARRGAPSVAGLRRLADRWPAPVAERVRAELGRCEAALARRRAWLRAAPNDDPETRTRVSDMRAAVRALLEGLTGLGDALGAPRRPATDTDAIDRIFTALTRLEAVRMR